MFSHPFSLLTGYGHYWLQALNQYSLHAPFVYQFYTETVKADQSLPLFAAIEAFRKAFLHAEKVVQTEDFGAGSSVTPNQDRKLSSIARHSLTPAKSSRLLYRIASGLPAEYCIELGTSLGINTLYLSAALPEGCVYTLEGCQATADEAAHLFAQCPLKNIKLKKGNIDQTLPLLLETIPRIDLLYIDANHRYAPTIAYYEQCKRKAHEDSIFIIDDIYWSGQMRQAWQEIQRDPDVSLSLDLFTMGLVFFKKLRNKQHYILMF